MQWLRSTWWKRSLVAVLVISLGPFLLGPPRASVAETTAAHAQWLRAQMTPLPAPSTASAASPAQQAVTTAMEAAVEAAPPTRKAFTRAFVAVYQQQENAVPLETLFAAPDVTDAALYEVLSRRSVHMTQTAVLPRLTMSTAPAAAHSGRSPAATPASLHPPLPSAVQAVALSELVGRRLPCILRTLFSARPMAP